MIYDNMLIMLMILIIDDGDVDDDDDDANIRRLMAGGRGEQLLGE